MMCIFLKQILQHSVNTELHTSEQKVLQPSPFFPIQTYFVVKSSVGDNALHVM